MSDFARIIRASDGEQVLFYETLTDDQEPAVQIVTRLDGVELRATVSDFKNDQGPSEILRKLGRPQADSFRAQLVAFTTPEDET